MSIVRLVWLANENDTTSVVDAVLESPISLVLALYGFFIFWSVGGLSAYHAYLTAIALTTHEEMKATFSSGNPYSVNILYNFVSVWCPPSYPSYRSYLAKPSKNVEDSYQREKENPDASNGTGIGIDIDIDSSDIDNTDPDDDADLEQEPLTYTRRDNLV
jgi:hypothetical protein